jgi:hypothetical protein
MGCRPNDSAPSKLNLKPEPSRISRSRRPSRAEAFTAEIRRELDPTGPLERLMADQVGFAGHRLREALEHASAAEADLAASSLREAIATFDLIRGRQGQPSAMAGGFGPENVDDGDFEFETDIDINIDPESEVEIEEAEEAPEWRERLIFDFEVSDVSPVVKGTWVTVSHVVSLIVDGWTWADILRAYPELAEDDVRACVNYTIFEEGVGD